MDNIKFYEVNREYINYLLPAAPHLFQNKKPYQQNERKYIGIILRVHNMDYFAPLSSFKPKHRNMHDSVDFLKVKDYAVINLNNMFPVPKSEYTYIDIQREQDLSYRALLRAEYRYIKSIQEKIRKNALVVYSHRLKYGDGTPLGKRCNDFSTLERLYKNYK
ncbi:MAG: type III toxin-antitoxin system ToxN/AbiQ family toxin [Clostridia bacterium]|nr:type III toxin-antitoxin system ToxN/AbiQ family toxin [Clostridia bacterium]